MTRQAKRDAGLPGVIPDKLYFRIGEVASLCGVETYVLRFWQTEFPQLAPKKSGTGQRLYRRRDVEQALRIKRLLHEEGYTIAGARGVFAAEAQKERKHPRAAAQPELALTLESASAEAREQAGRAADRAQAQLARMRLELRELHGMLSRTPSCIPGAPAARSGARSRLRDESRLFADEPG